MTKLDEAALHADLDVRPRNYTDPEVSLRPQVHMRSNAQHHLRAQPVGCMLKLGGAQDRSRDDALTFPSRFIVMNASIEGGGGTTKEGDKEPAGDGDSDTGDGSKEVSRRRPREKW